MPIKAVFFDIGGVVAEAQLEKYTQVGSLLFGSTPDQIRAVAQGLVPQLETARLNSTDFWQSVGEQLWMKGEGHPVDPAKTRSIWTDILKASLRLNVEILHLCRQLKRTGVVVAALSNTIAEHAIHYRRVGAYEPFDPVVLSCECGFRKPDQEIYQLALRSVRLDGKQCLLVDDLEQNLIAAEELGFRTHHFQNQELLKKALSRYRLL